MAQCDDGSVRGDVDVPHFETREGGIVELLPIEAIGRPEFAVARICDAPLTTAVAFCDGRSECQQVRTVARDLNNMQPGNGIAFK